MIFQLGIVGSTSIHEMKHHKVFLSKSIEESLQRVSCFILGEELFQKKAFCISLSSLTIYVGTVVINA